MAGETVGGCELDKAELAPVAACAGGQLVHGERDVVEWLFDVGAQAVGYGASIGKGDALSWHWGFQLLLLYFEFIVFVFWMS